MFSNYWVGEGFTSGPQVLSLEFPERGSARRAPLQNLFEASYKKVVITPPSLCLPDDGDVTCGNDSGTSNSSPSPRLALGKATISLARCSNVEPRAQKSKDKGAKNKNN